MPFNQDNPSGDASATPPLKTDDFFIRTSSEVDALERAVADGKHGRHYQNLPQEPARVHQDPTSRYFVRLALTQEEQMAGVTTTFLETLTLAQDADSAIALLYISHLLAPPSPLPPNTTATGKIDFDDVIEKIGWDPRTSAERRKMHKRLYDFIRFGERAQVNGERRGVYTDKHTGEKISTTVHSSIWRVQKYETLDTAGPEEAPIGVELVMGREWVDLLTKPQTAQYLPMGEFLGAIPGKKPSGAWARVIGLSLASFWRRNAREMVEGTIKPTRRELLDRYTPSTGSVYEITAKTNPLRAITYWCGALELLVEEGFIQRVGEAAISAEEMRAKWPTKGWVIPWLDERVDIRPCEDLQESLKGRATAAAKKPKIRKRDSKKSFPQF